MPVGNIRSVFVFRYFRVNVLARFKRLSRDFECMPQVLAGLHFAVFAMLILPKAALLLASGGSSQYALGDMLYPAMGLTLKCMA